MKNPMRTLLVLLCVLGLGVSHAAQCENPKVLRFSLTPKKNADSQRAEFRPLIKVLENTLKRPVEVVVASSYGAVVEGLLQGSIDVAEMGPASYAQVKARDPGITAFASLIQRVGPHTESGAHYRSLLIVRRDQNFLHLAQLRDLRVSLVDPASTSGALIPRQAIAQLTGVRFEAYFGRTTFAGSHDRAIQAVQKGFVDAAFVSSSRLDELQRNGSVAQDEIAVLWKSSPIPYDPFVYRKPLCAALVSGIERAFFQNNALLQAMFGSMHSTGFAHVHDDQYREIREIYATQP